MLSTALGWPDVDPVAVCHRTGPMFKDQADGLAELIAEYRDVLGGRTIASSPAEVRFCPGPDSGGGIGTAYVVQPHPRSARLGHQVLMSERPSADHRLVRTVVAAALEADREASLAAGFSQWTWDGSAARLAAVGAPMMWDQAGGYRFDLEPALLAFPAAARGMIRGQLEDRASRNQAPDNVLVGLVADLLRRNLDHWVQPVIDHCARDHQIYVSVEQARDFNRTEKRIRTTVTGLQLSERWWRESVREQPYAFFVPRLFLSA